MNVTNENSPYSIFDQVSLMQTGKEQLAQSALATGIDRYQSGDYKRAAQEFKRTIALSPYSENALNAYDFLANAYIQMNDTKNAESTYKSAIGMFPNMDDINLKLGNLYFSQKKYFQSEKEYQTAVKKNPSDINLYSLAHNHLNTSKLTEAERLFEKVIQISPYSGQGQYGMGMAYAKQEKYDMALEQFETALKLNPDFHDARVEMGYVLADMGKMDEAREQHKILEHNNSSLSSLLYVYMHKVEKPKMVSAESIEFNWNLSIKTPVSNLDLYQQNEDDTKLFTVKFQFNKQMDINSVQNILNWRISRSEGYGPNAYNFGLQLEDTEVDLPHLPKNVLYDPSSQTAFVTFAIQQNESGDGTIDPSHVRFSFSGIDDYGVEMDPEFDTFSKFEGFV